jgi:hypothetical protein
MHGDDHRRTGVLELDREVARPICPLPAHADCNARQRQNMLV